MAEQSQAPALLSALGTLIGYIGGESATEDVFEQLLWPQRFLNFVTWRDALRVGLLTPMCGPIHKAALTTLDNFHHNGLFKGRNVGNMLGTAFFHDTKLKYKVPNPPSGAKGKEYVRNGLWVRAISRIPIAGRAEKGQHPECGEKELLLVRAKSAVNFLKLENVSDARGVKSSAKVRADNGRVTVQTIFALILSEITGLTTGIFVLVYWRSAFSLLWFIALTLKLLSAAFTLEREGLLPSNSQMDSDPEPIERFEVNMRGNGFLVVEGKGSVVLQFFRHYGHPIRNHFRESTQIAIIICLGLVFPAGLVTSLLWMPVGMQYVWLSYQLYATIALYIHRYTKGRECCTTDALLAQKFIQRGKNEEGVAYLQDDTGNTVMGTLTRIPISRYKEGQEMIERYLAPQHTIINQEHGSCANQQPGLERNSGADTK